MQSNGANYTLNQIVNVFKEIADNHGQIFSFGQGDIFEINANEVHNYPILWVQVLPSSITTNTIEYNTRIIIADLVEPDLSNQLEVKSDAVSILWDVVALVRDYYDIQITDPTDITPFGEANTDRVSGFYADVALDIPVQYGYCDSPFKSVVSGSSNYGGSYPGNNGVGCGCEIATQNSSTLTFSGSGSVCFPLIANVQISTGSGNELMIRADGLFSSGSSGGSISIDTGSFVTTSSFQSFTSSITAQVNNVFSSESNYLPTASYLIDSGSFNTRINNITSSAPYDPTNLNGATASLHNFSSSILTYTGSVNTQLTNIFASESKYTLSSSFNSFTSSVNIQLTNIFASESNYTLTSSFNPFQANINTYTASVNTQLANIFASESNYLPTASFVNVGTISGSGVLNNIALFNDTSSISSSAIAQGASTITIPSTFTLSAGVLRATNGITVAHNGAGGNSYQIYNISNGSTPFLFCGNQGTNSQNAINGNNTAQCTWDVTVNSLGVSSSNNAGLLLANNTTASISLNQYSPGIRFRGNAWTGSGNSRVDMKSYLATVSGSSATGYLTFESSINTASYSANLFNIHSGGNISIGQVPITSSYLSIKAGTTAISQINLSSGSAPTAPRDGDLWYESGSLKFRMGGVTKTVTLT